MSVTRTLARLALVAAATVAPALPVVAQSRPPYDVEIARPTTDLPDGTPAHATFDLSRTLKNWAGTDGAGCCVMASTANNAIVLGSTDVAETIRRISSARPGGHWPEKYRDQMREVVARHPGVIWVQDPSADYETLRRWNELGVPLGTTYGWGRRYGQPIAHMVSVAHVGPYDDGWCVVVDNNFPREAVLLPAPEYWRRATIGSPVGRTWMTAILSTRGVPEPEPEPEPAPAPAPNPGPASPPTPTDVIAVIALVVASLSLVVALLAYRTY